MFFNLSDIYVTRNMLWFFINEHDNITNAWLFPFEYRIKLKAIYTCITYFIIT